MHGVCTEHPVIGAYAPFVLQENWDLNFYVYMFMYSFAVFPIFVHYGVRFISMVQMLGIIMGEFK